MTTKKVYKRLSNCMWTFMTTSVEELITRVLLGRPKRTLGQKLNISGQVWRKTVPEDLRYKSYVMKRGQLMSEYLQARERKEDWLKKNPSEVS
jgi:hypothetical protein